MTEKEIIINDLIACGQIAKYWHWRQLFYALKNAILRFEGTADEYDLQKWEDIDFFEGNYTDTPDVISEHEHILERWILFGHVFHIPTDEFRYFNFEYQTEKRSKGFAEYILKCKETIIGKRQYQYTNEMRHSAWLCLKHLIRQYGWLIINRAQMRLMG